VALVISIAALSDIAECPLVPQAGMARLTQSPRRRSTRRIHASRNPPRLIARDFVANS
jgi:hypothetical protein